MSIIYFTYILYIRSFFHIYKSRIKTKANTDYTLLTFRSQLGFEARNIYKDVKLRSPAEIKYTNEKLKE